MQTTRSAGLAMSGLGIGMRESWTVWSRRMPKTQFTFRRTTKPFTGAMPIREYLKAPLSHGVSNLAFEVTYIKQQGPIAWDVGTYRMTIPHNDDIKREDHGKYLTVWRRVGKDWLIAADAWSSDLPPLA